MVFKPCLTNSASCFNSFRERIFKSFVSPVVFSYIKGKTYVSPAVSISAIPSTPLKTTLSFLRHEVFLSFLVVVPIAWTTSLGILPIRSKSGMLRFDLVISSSTGGACMYRLFPLCVMLAFDNSNLGCSFSRSMNCCHKTWIRTSIKIIEHMTDASNQNFTMRKNNLSILTSALLWQKRRD